jgi:hypothetical protein
VATGEGGSRYEPLIARSQPPAYVPHRHRQCNPPTPFVTPKPVVDVLPRARDLRRNHRH